jgi:hypothetical protein
MRIVSEDALVAAEGAVLLQAASAISEGNSQPKRSLRQLVAVLTCIVEVSRSF